MSFLLDPPALFGIGYLLGRRLDDGRRRRLAGVLAVGTFVLVSGLLYTDRLPWWWGRWIPGSDWMLNSGLPTRFERTRRTDALALALFAAYPLWLALGVRLGRPPAAEPSVTARPVEVV